MQTQRDHVHAHQFQMARMSSALILGDPSMAENPMRRTVTGLLAGLLVALLGLLAFGVYGFIVPGGATAWRKPGAVIVEKESGTQYVLVGGKLHPALNMASAMIINGSGSRVELVSRNSLKDVPRGAPVGIHGAPQVLPAQPADVVRGPWLICLTGSASATTASSLGFNFDPRAPAAVLPADRFMFVSDGNAMYLLWRDHKHRVTDNRIPVALGVPDVPALQASRSWLRNLADGPDLRIPAIRGAGSAGREIDGRPASVGQLFRQQTVNGEQFFVLREKGLAPINRTMFQLLQAKGGPDPLDIGVAAVAAAPRSSDRSLTEAFTDLSASRWESGREAALCARQSPGANDTFTAQLVLTTKEFGGVRSDGTGKVVLSPGTAVLVYPAPRGLGKPTPFLIADAGLRYSLPDKDAMAAMRLPEASLVPFPEDLLELIPSGPALSRSMINTEREG